MRIWGFVKTHQNPHIWLFCVRAEIVVTGQNDLTSFFFFFFSSCLPTPPSRQNEDDFLFQNNALCIWTQRRAASRLLKGCSKWVQINIAHMCEISRLFDVWTGSQGNRLRPDPELSHLSQASSPSTVSHRVLHAGLNIICSFIRVTAIEARDNPVNRTPGRRLWTRKKKEKEKKRSQEASHMESNFQRCQEFYKMSWDFLFFQKCHENMKIYI